MKHEIKHFSDIPIQESGDPLIPVEGFFQKPQYYIQNHTNSPQMFLRSAVVEKLRSVEEELNQFGYRLVIWDCWRSRNLQNTLFDSFYHQIQNQYPSESESEISLRTLQFVQDARDLNKVSPHLSGGAVDLSLALLDGNEIEMGAPFDYLGPESSSLYFEGPGKNEEIRRKRRILRDAMYNQGFSGWPEEFWHFDYGNQLWAFTLGEKAAFYGEVSP